MLRAADGGGVRNPERLQAICHRHRGDGRRAEELAQLRRWSIGNAVEAVVFKLLRTQAKKHDIQRLEAAKERLGRITSEVDPERFQFPMVRGGEGSVMG
jgi:hypothetical protein